KVARLGGRQWACACTPARTQYQLNSRIRRANRVGHIELAECFSVQAQKRINKRTPPSTTLNRSKPVGREDLPRSVILRFVEASLGRDCPCMPRRKSRRRTAAASLCQQTLQ